MSFFNMSEKAYLLLQDGTVFEGLSFGAKGTVAGEVVFNTRMTGYQQTMTDPSNLNQIVVQTFPLIGNVGVNSEDDESENFSISGYIVREWCDKPSNFRSEGDINEYMKKRGIIGLHSIDTRALTRILRNRGTMNGIITGENVYKHKDELLKNISNLIPTVQIDDISTSEIKKFKSENAKYTVAVYDFGCKRYLINQLLEHKCDVILLPAKTSDQKVKELAPDGIFLSSGPGDPAKNQDIINNIAEVSQLDIPIFAVCFGHQILALSQGGVTKKLRHGHRGASIPVIDLELGRTFVTAQNHGYSVDFIPESAGEITHINANDKTCEGIRYKEINAFSVQFMPEVHSDPLDCEYLLDAFVEMMGRKDA